MLLKRLQVVVFALLTLALIAGAVFVVIALKSLAGHKLFDDLRCSITKIAV